MPCVPFRRVDVIYQFHWYVALRKHSELKVCITHVFVFCAKLMDVQLMDYEGYKPGISKDICVCNLTDVCIRMLDYAICLM